MKAVADGFEFAVITRTDDKGEPFQVWQIAMPVPEAKKNRGHIRMVRSKTGFGLRPVIAPNKAAATFEKRLRLELDAFLRADPRRAVWQALGAVFPTCDVAVEMDYDHHKERVVVSVFAMRARPKGKTGRRRDLHNILEAILDGMQTTETRTGLKLGLFANDNQVARIVQERIP